MPSYSEALEQWRKAETMPLEELIKKPDGTRVLVDVTVKTDPIISRGEAIFYGLTAGSSFHIPGISIDYGAVRGQDSNEVHTMTFYIDDRVRVWSESRDTDEFTDSASYVQLSEKTRLKIKMGVIKNTSKSVNPINEGVPELKMEYLVIKGPNDTYEETILNKENGHHPDDERRGLAGIALRTIHKFGIGKRIK